MSYLYIWFHSLIAKKKKKNPLQSTFKHCAVIPAGLPKMLAIRSYFGVPSPTAGPPLSIQTGDVIELICADLHSPWWQVRDWILWKLY